MKEISSSSNFLVKEIRKLGAGKRRVQESLILIEGVMEVSRALEGGVKLRTMIVSPEILKKTGGMQTVSLLFDQAPESVSFTPELFTRISFRRNPEGVLAVAHRPSHDPEELKLRDDSLVLVVEGVEKPGNIGAIFRNADGAGVSAVLIAGSGADIFSRQAIRGSMGSIFTVPFAEVTVAEAIVFLRRLNFRILASTPAAELEYTAGDYTRPCAVLVGSEKEGLSPELLASADTLVRIPMRGVADSLNVSASTAILLYEATRETGVAESE